MTEQMKHTPGPWKYLSFRDETDPQRNAAHKEMPFSWWVVSDSQWVCATMHGNEQHNAKLIAAAPDLNSYRVYVQDKIAIDEMPLDYTSWLELERDAQKEWQAIQAATEE